MKNTWRKHTLVKVDLTNEQRSELFCGVLSTRLNDKLSELDYLEDGYYEVEGLKHYFKIETVDLTMYKMGTHRNIMFPSWKENVVTDYLDSLYEEEERERQREEQKEEGEIMAEMTVFNNDLSTPIEFVDGVATLKNYCRKTVEVHKDEDGEGWYFLYLDGKESHINIVQNQDDGTYSSYDGLDGHGWYKTIKEAVKSHMNAEIGYINSHADEEEYYEPSCSNCRDGGCIHCEPHRFL